MFDVLQSWSLPVFPKHAAIDLCASRRALACGQGMCHLMNVAAQLALGIAVATYDL